MAERLNTTDEMSAEESTDTDVSSKATEPDDTEELPIVNEFSRLSLDCKMCKGSICKGESKHQHWTGKTFELKAQELKDPKFTPRYHLPEEYINTDDTVNLSHILKNLPDVLIHIQEPSTPYKELQNLLKKVDKLERAQTAFKQKKIFASIKASYNGDTNVKAPYLREIKTFPREQTYTTSSKLYYIDCEYILTVSIPSQSAYNSFLEGDMFKPKDHKLIDENGETDKYRWIFIPSSDRFDMKDVIFDRSHFQTGGEMSRGDTLCFVVVRGNQFNSYRKSIGDRLPVIQLPENVIGVGYARFWIVKIAKRFQLCSMWMVDDSVTSFKENIPNIIESRFNLDTDASKMAVNSRCPEYCFQKMETILKNQRNVVAISPRKHRPHINVREEFTYKPVQSVILLNIKKLTEKHIDFRPEFRYMEDMIFSKECTNVGLIVCRWNAIIFKDNTTGKFKETGANTTSQSPRGK